MSSSVQNFTDWAFHDRVVMSAMMIPYLQPRTREEHTDRFRNGRTPRLLDACTRFVDPFLLRTSIERGWSLTVCDLEPSFPEVVHADLCGRLPWDDYTFSGVISTDTMEHVPDIKHALGELFRVTTPGGLLILGLPIGVRGGELSAATAPYAEPNQHHHRWHPGLDIADWALDAGYQKVGELRGQGDARLRVRYIGLFARPA